MPSTSLAQKQIILVLGMHRSGTSALTRVISLKGVALPANLMPPVEGVNAAGFWESDDIVELHERLLARAGLSWQSVEPFPEGWFASSAVQPFKEELKGVLARNLEVSDTLVIKDPRTSRMVPLWKEVAHEMGVGLSFVIAIRNPLEVAQSLKARSGFAYQPEGLPYTHSFALWLRYFLEAEATTRGEKRAVVSYEQLMENWQAVVSRIEQGTGFLFPVNDEESTEAINRFISAGHRHHESSKEALEQEEAASSQLKSIYAAALMLTEGKQPKAGIFDEALLGKQSRRGKNPLPYLKQAVCYLMLAAIQPLPDRIYNPIRRKIVQKNAPFQFSATEPRNTGITPLAHYLEQDNKGVITPHPLFDAAYYLQHNKDVAASGVDPFLHFLLSGAIEGRSPHPLFDTGYYLEQQQEALGNINPVQHFLLAKNPANPHPLFDVAYYLEHNQDVAETGQNPLVHFLLTGGREGRNPHPLFDCRYYLEQNRDVALSGQNPLLHFLRYGAAEGRNPHPLVDIAYYVQSDPAILASGLNPLVHFIHYGGREGRQPHLLFDSAYYLEQNKDVQAAGVNPLVHFLTRGAAEGRWPNRLFDTGYYTQNYPDVGNAGINPLLHYIAYGAEEKRNPHVLFNTAYYVAQMG